MSPLEEKTYNTWLRISRTRQRKAFKYRKDFATFEKDKPSEFLHVRRIARFFQKYHHIAPESFFEAPYEVYDDHEGFYDLQFYASQAALRCYTVRLKKLRALPPDEMFQLEEIIRSFKWIANYCITHDVELRNYTSSQGKVVAPFVQHMKQHYVTIFAVLAFPSSMAYLTKMPRDSFELMLGDSVDIHALLHEYNKSTKAKLLAENAYRKLEKTVSESLKLRGQNSK